MDRATFLEWRRTGALKLRDRLIVDNQRIVHNIVRQYAMGSDYEDLFQEGIIGLIEALHNYDPSRGTGFYGYAKWKVLYRIQECIRLKAGISTSRNKLDKAGAAEALYGHVGLRERGAVASPSERADARRTIRRAVRDLSDLELRAIIAHSEGAEQQELAAMLKISRHKVDDCIAELKERARDSIENPQKRICWRCLKAHRECVHV